MLTDKFAFKSIASISLAIAILMNISACNTEKNDRIVTHADYKTYSDIEDVVADTDVIVIGKVKKVYPPQEWNINLDKTEAPVNQVFTLSDIEVISSAKGPSPNTIITIKQPGGVYKGKTYEEEGTIFVETEKEYLFFLDSYDDWDPKEPYSLINPSQGMIEVNDNYLKSNNNLAYIENSISKTEIIEKLKAINENLPTKKIQIDRELEDKLRNR
ncbi:hypothetical protein D3C76_425730 [compost metagenome]